MNQKTALAAGALAGAAATLFLRRRQRPVSIAAAPAADPRAEELRQKLAEARRADVDERDFEAAGMGAETIVEEGSRPRPQPPPPHRPSPAPPPRPAGDEFEAMRRRIHQEGRAAAEEMRRGGEPPPPD